MDHKPEGFQRLVFKYLCPICFFYYPNILQFKCCKNYICYSCVEDINHNFSIQPNEIETVLYCIFCREKTSEIEDLDEEDKTRKYEDSPANVKYERQKILSLLGS